MTEAKIAQLTEDLYKAPVLYQWEFIGDGLATSGQRWIMSIVPCFIGFLIFYFLIGFKFGDLLFNTFATLCLLFVFISRYLFSPDKHTCYNLTELGIHYTEQDIIPEVAYKIMRGFGVFGVMVCIAAVFLIGPMAFVGAGASALLSFGLTNFRPTVKKRCSLFPEKALIFYAQNCVQVHFKDKIYSDFYFELSGTLFCHGAQAKQALIAQIKKHCKEVEVYEIARMRDMYDHPNYRSVDAD